MKALKIIGLIVLGCIVGATVVIGGCSAIVYNAIDETSKELNQEIEVENKKKEEINNNPPITLEDFALDFKEGYSSPADNLYEYIYTVKNNSEYTVTGLNIKVLQPSNNETTYIDMYEVLNPDDTSSNHSVYPNSGLEELQMIEYTISYKDKEVNDKSVSYNVKLKEFSVY